MRNQLINVDSRSSRVLELYLSFPSSLPALSRLSGDAQYAKQGSAKIPHYENHVVSTFPGTMHLRTKRALGVGLRIQVGLFENYYSTVPIYLLFPLTGWLELRINSHIVRRRMTPISQEQYDRILSCCLAA